MDNNFEIAAEVELNKQAKKMGLDFFKPSDYALGWRHCIDWIQSYEAALQSVTLKEQKEPEAIEFAEWISTEGYMRLSKKVGHKWVKIGEPETYETAEVYKLYKSSIESDRICTENVKRAFKSI